MLPRAPAADAPRPLELPQSLELLPLLRVEQVHQLLAEPVVEQLGRSEYGGLEVTIAGPLGVSA